LRRNNPRIQGIGQRADVHGEKRGRRRHRVYFRAVARAVPGAQESGGPPVKPPERKGFGSVLIERALQRELGGVEYAFDPGGVICTLELKL